MVASGAVANVAGLYAALRDDIVNGTRTVPDFDDTARLVRLMDAMAWSGQTAAP